MSSRKPIIEKRKRRRKKKGKKKKRRQSVCKLSMSDFFTQYGPFSSISPTKHDKWLFTLCPTISSSPTTPLLSGFSNLLNSCLLYYEGGGFKIFFNITKATWFYDPPFSSFDNSKI
jgi:hypothetical protein